MSGKNFAIFMNFLGKSSISTFRDLFGFFKLSNHFKIIFWWRIFIFLNIYQEAVLSLKFKNKMWSRKVNSLFFYKKNPGNSFNTMQMNITLNLNFMAYPNLILLIVQRHASFYILNYLLKILANQTQNIQKFIEKKYTEIILNTLCVTFCYAVECSVIT